MEITHNTINELRLILKTLVAHRAAHPKPPRGDICLADIPMLPPWEARMNRAADDGVEQSLLASIREHGWRAFAEGGKNEMHRLVNEACGDNERLANIVYYQWNGIGNADKGHWWI